MLIAPVPKVNTFNNRRIGWFSPSFVLAAVVALLATIQWIYVIKRELKYITYMARHIFT